MKTVFFLGQAPAKPGTKHDVPGTYLHAWLHKIGLSDDDIRNYCHFYALVGTFPGANKSGHLPPTKAQIALHRPFLADALTKIKPDIIVPVGKLAISEITGTKNAVLEQYIGTTLLVNPLSALSGDVLCIPLPHPSGRSAWNHLHKELVEQALALLQKEAS